MNLAETWNSEFIDAQYKLWQSDPDSVSKDWQFFFAGFELAAKDTTAPADSIDAEQVQQQARVHELIHRYRDIGHLLACLDPLVACPTDHPLLSLESFQLSPQDLTRSFFAPQLVPAGSAPLSDIVAILRETYCRSIGVEFMHLQDPQERNWLIDRMEPGHNRPQLSSTSRKRILEKLIEAAVFENFLNKKYMAVTRFSLEGGDVILAALKELAESASQKGCRNIILGMAHRGRLNVQAHILTKPYDDIFSEFEHCYDPDSVVGAGDVKYHNGYMADIQTAGGGDLRILLVNNPSHLEAVDPVVEGVARAVQDRNEDRARAEVLPLLIHGDAAFAGQGVVAETLNMSQLQGYHTGGTIHLIINNQIGYTTLPEHARSTRYSTDVAKMLMVPIFHVHGENPEAVVHAVQLAVEYRWQFGKDVVIDVVCYRRYGHNEGDEPYFTQPQMYDRIRERPSLHKTYKEQLIADGVVTKSDAEAFEADVNRRLETSYDHIHGSACALPQTHYLEIWDGYHGSYSHDPIETAVASDSLIDLANKLARTPDDFNVNPKLKRMLDNRLATVEKGSGIDWANAEALAFASLLVEGSPVRLSGQDSGRGTFSQRHSVLVDIKNGEKYVPLKNLSAGQGRFEVYDSLLSEAGVMGFDYGYSTAYPEALVLWEAQFGDFANNAQAVIDLFIASGETKWQRLSALVLLLPHGFEGLGPEHSSARLERFLQLCAEDNMQVCNPSTPAQYFHLLRRQVRAPFRKPLIVMTPKSLLRHPLARSATNDLADGGFHPILDDPVKVPAPEKVLICSGKIYYELVQRRDALEPVNTTILRLEQFYPFPEQHLSQIAEKYQNVESWSWVQEEPENMGGWQFVRHRLSALIKRNINYVGREAAASPASGFPHVFKRQQAAIIDAAVGPVPQKTSRTAVN